MNAIAEELLRKLVAGEIMNREECAAEYAKVIRACNAGNDFDVAALNSAILNHWSKAGLDFIKKRGWEQAESYRITVEVRGDPEATESPWWAVVDPQQNMRADLAVAAGQIVGPFFSRRSAEEYLSRRHYDYSKRAAVWCFSGCWSQEYKEAIREAKRRAATLGVTTVSIKAGWHEAGRKGKQVGEPVFVQQWWVPVLWEDEEDPDFFKAAGLDGVVGLPAEATV